MQAVHRAARARHGEGGPEEAHVRALDARAERGVHHDRVRAEWKRGGLSGGWRGRRRGGGGLGGGRRRTRAPPARAPTRGRPPGRGRAQLRVERRVERVEVLPRERQRGGVDVRRRRRGRLWCARRRARPADARVHHARSSTSPRACASCTTRAARCAPVGYCSSITFGSRNGSDPPSKNSSTLSFMSRRGDAEARHRATPPDEPSCSQSHETVLSFAATTNAPSILVRVLEGSPPPLLRRRPRSVPGSRSIGKRPSKGWSDRRTSFFERLFSPVPRIRSGAASFRQVCLFADERAFLKLPRRSFEC